MHIFVILVRSKSLHFHRRLSSKMVTNKEKGVEMRFDNGKHVLSSDRARKMAALLAQGKSARFT